MKKPVFAFAAVLALAACSRAPEAPGKRYDVDGHAMYIACSGTAKPGQPTVIVEAGLGGMTGAYHWVQAGVAEFARVCTYDRAGIGWSDDSGTSHDAAEVARQLHALLAAAKVAPPYVLAGHSLAGLLMPVYVKAYPGDVSGLVYLDPSHPRQWELLPGGVEAVKNGKRMFKLMGYATSVGLTDIYNPLVSSYDWIEKYPPEIQAQIRYFGKQSRGYFTSYEEFEAFAESARQAATVTSLGDRPLVVISAGTMPAKTEEEKAKGAELLRVIGKLHEETSQLSTRGRHVLIPGASHMTLIADKTYADQAVAEIKRVVEEATTQ